MRGHLGTNAKWMFVRAFTVATLTSTAWYLWIVKPRKDGYREFYATYDPDIGDNNVMIDDNNKKSNYFIKSWIFTTMYFI